MPPFGSSGNSSGSNERISDICNMPLMPDLLDWSQINVIWAIIGDNKSENYIKNTLFIKEYKLAVRRF